MFSEKLKRTLKKYPRWESLLTRVGDYLARVPPGRDVDPLVIAKRIEMPLGEVLALLEVLSEESAGKLELRVVDPEGQAVGTFASRRDIPPVIEDQFGREIQVDPENVELVFRLSER